MERPLSRTKKFLAPLCAMLLAASPAAAQVAISQLPAASALAGTEVAPVVQSGTTSKATINQIDTLVAGKAHTWSLTQTFTLAPVFTDASGSRTALGLGTAATVNTGTSGATIPLLNGSNTWSALQTFSGSTTVLAATFPNIGETATISATAATGTINYDITTQSILYFTTNASANWTVNIRGNGSTTLNSLLSTGQAVTLAFLVTQGGTAFFNSAVQVDGTTSGVTTKWQGGSAPAAGDINSIDVYTYTVIKTGSAAFTVLASLTKFA